MPDGIRRSTVFLSPITSVWPALWPPWKRTTPWACSVSQSTTLPLPSSPHWVPITTTFLPMVLRPPVCCGSRSEPSRRAADEGCELAQVECEAGRRTGAAERLADAVVALAAADRVWLAGGKHRETRAALIVIAAQVGQIDMQRFDLVARGVRKSLQGRERAGDRRGIRQLRARPRQDLVGRSVQRRQQDERLAPCRGEPGGQGRHGGHVLGAHRREELAVAALPGQARAVGKGPVNADVPEVEMQPVHCRG